MAGWVHAGRFDEIVDGRGRRVEILGLHLAVFRAGDAVVALSDRCPHAGGYLGDGWFRSMSGHGAPSRTNLEPGGGRWAVLRCWPGAGGARRARLASVPRRRP